MKVAIYSRYSTDAQDATSLSGQIANCEAIARSNGWTVIERYSDEAISGSDDSRLGYTDLLAASEAGGFDGIVVDETSRLTRRPGELPRILEVLAFRNQFLVDCKGFDSRHETASLLASVYGGIDTLELRKIKDRTHRGLRERAKNGFSAGGRTYGYTTEAVDPEDPQSKRRTVIVPEQAEIVREIFQRYADGEAPRSICDDLNARGIPSPGSSWNRTKKRCRGWVGSALSGSAKTYSGILRNDLYAGRYIWNRRKMKKIPGTSKRIAEIRPKDEWIVNDHPELQIIDDGIWERVQTRLKNARKRASEANKRSRGRPPKYLLSGLMTCGVCGANFIMRDTRSYMCSSHANSGHHLCANGIRVRREIAEQAVLQSIKAQLLTPEATQYIGEQVRAVLKELESLPDDSALLSHQLRVIEEKLAKVTDAIEAVGISDTLTKRLTTLESEKADTEAAIRRLPAPFEYHPATAERIVGEVRALVESLESVGGDPRATLEDIEAVRGNLRTILGPITLLPQDGVLWAYPNEKGPTEVRPLEELRINSPESGSGGRI